MEDEGTSDTADGSPPDRQTSAALLTASARPSDRVNCPRSIHVATPARGLVAFWRLPQFPMLTGEIRSQIDNIWNAFWTGGISNPLEVIEQINDRAAA